MGTALTRSTLQRQLFAAMSSFARHHFTYLIYTSHSVSPSASAYRKQEAHLRLLWSKALGRICSNPDIK